MSFVAALVAAAFLQPTPLHLHVKHHHRPVTVRSYARQLTLRRWHSVAEWRALNRIVVPESNWDPCAHYPSTHDCSYNGSNACGIPQRYYCPRAWRGRLWTTRWAQVRDLIAYVSGRYGDPIHALWYHETYGTY